MTNFRRWQLDATSPFSLQIAADARFSQTDYTDDQIWEINLGSGKSPALALQTRYGGRAGLASIVPMWLHDGRAIYQTQAYAKQPYITAFAPGYIRLQATLTPQLALQAEFWVMESHAVGAQLTVANAHTTPTDIRLDLLGFVGIGGKEQKTTRLTTPSGSSVLSLGQVGNLSPIITLDNADSVPNSDAGGGKIGQSVTIDGRKKVVFRWVHTALPDIRESIALGNKWLQQDWEQAFQQISDASQTIPVIETGNSDWDATIAFAYQQLMQCFLRPTSSLPYTSFVSMRQPNRGFNPHEVNTRDRAWGGQSPIQAYLLTLAIASSNPSFAEGVIRNYLAVQQSDGWIDWKPGLAGQKQGILCLPILARMTWGIFQYTEDAEFLRDVFPGLLKFFERWLQPDLDNDGDGLREWRSENQTGYVFTPTFATWQGWGQGADIRLAEMPDLATYLLSEAMSLREIAYFLRAESATDRLDGQIADLRQHLENLWNSDLNRYAYRDRDTHTTTEGVSIVHDGRSGDDLILAEKIQPANRLIVKVSGGIDLTPQFTMELAGFDQNGSDISEEVGFDQFLWSHGRGVYTSRKIFSQIDKITFDGLSRVYRVDVDTVDTSRLDINAILPLWLPEIAPEHATALSELLLDPNKFWRASGVTMCSAADPNFDPSNANGSGGVWPFWLTLIGEGLIEHGATQSAYALLKHLLNTQTTVLKGQKSFSEFYHSDAPIGLGEAGHTGGLVPLHLLMRLIGVRIVNSAKVWVGGKFAWEKPITIHQHGVTVQRTDEATHIEFPSGYQTDLKSNVDNSWHEVADPNPVITPVSPPTPAHYDDLEPEID